MRTNVVPLQRQKEATYRHPRNGVSKAMKRHIKGHETAYQTAGQYGTPQTLIDAGGRGFRELALETS
jgi:hypothetical protein